MTTRVVPVLPPDAPTLLTAEDVAFLLRIQVQTLRKWVRAGTFPAPAHIGHNIRWDPATVTAALAARGLKLDVMAALNAARRK
jgi:predicted DNA-binding transcriptional regulator AlpA